MASTGGIAAPPEGGMQYSTVGAALDDSFYQLDDVETTFVSGLTGIKDPAELKKHILQVQHEVYAVSIPKIASMLWIPSKNKQKLIKAKCSTIGPSLPLHPALPLCKVSVHDHP